MKRLVVMAASLLACSLLTSLVKADMAEEQQKIAAEVAKYVAAFNKQDAKAIAGLWTEGGTYINPRNGEQFVGREEIEKQFAQMFTDSKNARLEATSQTIQLVSPSVAIEQGVAVVTVPDQTPESSEYSAVYVKVNGTWLLDRITEEQVIEAPSNHEHLKDLAWMVGSWVDQSDTEQIEMSCQWSKNRNFLIRTFAVTSGGESAFAGIQVIGWDPIRKQIRSWVFDSDGGYGDGFWRKRLQSWHVQTTGTLPDGAKASGVSVMTYIDDNQFTFQTIERQVDGELLPNIPESLVIRKQDSQ